MTKRTESLKILTLHSKIWLLHFPLRWSKVCSHRCLFFLFLRSLSSGFLSLEAQPGWSPILSWLHLCCLPVLSFHHLCPELQTYLSRWQWTSASVCSRITQTYVCHFKLAPFLIFSSTRQDTWEPCGAAPWMLVSLPSPRYPCASEC